MKKFGLLFVIAFAFLWTDFQGEAKQSQEQEKEYVILELVKPSVYNVIHNYLDFAVVCVRDGIKRKYYFEVNPSGLKIEVRTDKTNVTTLKTLSSYEKEASEILGIAVSPATLLVPNKEDKKLWQDYLEKLGEKYKLDGKITGSSTFVVDGQMYAELDTDLRFEWPGIPKSLNFNRAAVPVDGVSVVADSQKAKDGPLLKITWPDYEIRLLDDDSSFPIVWAKKLTIYVNEKDSKTWEDRIKDWKLKFEPRRVLPPSDD